MPLNFHPATPIFRVSNLSDSVDYYIKRLGFELDWDYEDIVAQVSRDNCNIMLVRDDQGKGKAWAYVGIADAEELHNEYQQSEARIRQEPTNFSWALEMQVEDLDGNVIRFGSDSKADTSYGPWLGAEGKSWEID